MRKLISFLAVALLVAATSLAASFDSVIKEYRGVFLGTERDQVRQKLGNPKDEFPAEDSFELSENESVRVFYADDKKVKAIVITYSGKLDTAPKPNDVVGEAVQARDDGGMYKMVRFEDKGFWVSYVKIAGDNPSIIITVQALPKAA
ncbi:MAG TPA: hypothetical protein VFZ49_03315 [Pyrinomonadaceae bacterium]